MAHQTYVVFDPAEGLYMTAYNIGNPSQSSFGNSDIAVEYDTLVAAQSAAERIGGGTVGTTKPS